MYNRYTSQTGDELDANCAPSFPQTSLFGSSKDLGALIPRDINRAAVSTFDGSPTPIFTSDTLDTYKLLVSMLPRPPKYLSSDRHRYDEEDTLSTAPTLVDDTETIRTLMADQPFVLYEDPSDPHDTVVIRSAPFRKFLEENGNRMRFVASVPWLVTILANHKPRWPRAFTVLQLICKQRVVTVADEGLKQDKETQMSYGRCLIARSLGREGKIQLDSKNQTASE
ncbi:hypothetical protein MaudCBS49596_001584 [Microsporum audouinii]